MEGGGQDRREGGEKLAAQFGACIEHIIQGVDLAPSVNKGFGGKLQRWKMYKHANNACAKIVVA